MRRARPAALVLALFMSAAPSSAAGARWTLQYAVGHGVAATRALASTRDRVLARGRGDHRDSGAARTRLAES